jgi:gluconate 5-dehydrogenase
MTLEMFSLQGRTALITGSSQGIGFALARGLASAGATVIVNGRRVEKLTAAAEALRAESATIVEAAFDATDSHAVKVAIDKIEAEVGAIDILVNNTGIQRRGSLVEMPDETWHEVMKANVDSVFYVSKAVASHMIPRNRGKIINICSVMSELGRPTVAPYTASKGAVKMLTKAMCAEWAAHNIQVNGIGPGYFKTELTEALVNDETFSAWLTTRTPARRWGEVQELAGAAVFLASPASDFVNGHILYVDGGITAVL